MLSSSSCCSTWSLNRALVLLLLGGYMTLLVEIRSEHVDVVHEYWMAWTPLVYCGLMILLTALALGCWNAATRAILFWAFSLGLIVSLWGLYLHNHTKGGHHFPTSMHELGKAANDFAASIHALIAAWYDPELHRGDNPPPPRLAPIAFAGLAFIGMFSTCKYRQPAENK